MKKILLSLLIVISFTSLTNILRAQNPPDTIWTKLILFGDDSTVPVDILPTAYKGYIVVVNYVLNNEGQIAVVKLNTDGEIINIQHIGSNGSRNVSSTSISPTCDGGGIISGEEILIDNTAHPLLIKVTKGGNISWEKIITSYPYDADGIRALQTQTGYLMLCSAVNSGIIFPVQIKTDLEGNFIDSYPFFDDAAAFALDMIKLPDNKFAFICGEHLGQNDLIRYVKTDDSGNRFMVRSIILQQFTGLPGPAHMQLNKDNEILIGGTGYCLLGGTTVFTLGLFERIDLEGNILDYNVYGDTITGISYSIEDFLQSSHNSNIACGGYSSSTESGSLIMKIDSLMNIKYQKINFSPYDVTEFFAIKKDYDDNLILGGEFNYTPYHTAIIAKLKADMPSYTIISSGLGLAINDNDPTSDVIYYGGINKVQAETLIGVDVMIDTVLHTSTGDLEFTLSHNGIIDTLIYHAGESGDNFIQTILSDVAQSPVDLASAPFTGFYRPTSSLSKFSGVDPTGDWTLSILDNVAGNTGMLNSWGLRFYFEGPVGVDDETPDVISDYMLYQNYPNPFNPSTVISYQLPVGGNVVLKVYDILGNEVATLIDEYKPAGKYEVDFDATELTSGVYFYQLKAGEFIQVKKMILIK